MSIIPQEYPLVLAGLAGTGVVVTAILFRAGSYRKAAGVEYPALYADAAEAKVNKAAFTFNCAQRGAFNVLETYPQTLVWLATAGLVLPRTAAGLAALYSIGAFGFASGYVAGPEKRYSGAGAVFRLAQLAAIGTAGYASFVLVTEALK